jgi:hypothetical protein
VAAAGEDVAAPAADQALTGHDGAVARVCFTAYGARSRKCCFTLSTRM